MKRNQSTIVWASIASAIVGALATLLFVDSSYELQSRTNPAQNLDAGKPPKPEWKTSAKQPDGAPTDGRNSIASDQQRRALYPRPSLESPPQAKQTKEDASADPHTTPQALLEFAEQLAKSMEGAFSDQETRYTVSRQLIACARDAQARGSAQAARALCLANLERLKNKFPEELVPSYQALLADLPEDLLFVAGVKKASEEK